METYSNYSYIYPPRPKNTIPPSKLEKYENNIIKLLAQPKLNGSNCTLYINKDKIYTMNRHNGNLQSFEIQEDIKKLNLGDNGWTVINGEYMNKNKKDTNKKSFNHKFVIFDILVYEGKYLINQSFKQRIDLLQKIFSFKKPHDEFIDVINKNVYMVKTFTKGFEKLFNELIQHDMYEGLVLKTKIAKLKKGLSKNNNSESQIKCRKPTKNYSF